MAEKAKGKRILVMGLNNSGKTSFSVILRNKLICPYFNADQVRRQFQDYDFSIRGRRRQARRMKILCDWALKLGHEFAIADFICPTFETRKLFDPHYIVFMDTIDESHHSDTNTIFAPPLLYSHLSMRVSMKKDFQDLVDKFVWRVLKTD